MLTATETQRIKNFTEDMDSDTAKAMLSLFEITKPGCNEATYELMDAAHGQNRNVSAEAITSFMQYGLVTKTGTIPTAIKSAIRKAVAECYLMMHGPDDPALKPDLAHLNYD